MRTRRAAAEAAFTLVELLAVVAILALAAALALGSVSGLSQSHQRRAAIAAVVGGLERVRLLAERFDGVALTAEGPGQALVGRAADMSVRVALPHGWRAECRDPSGAAIEGPIDFDGRGRSRDFDVALIGPKGASARLGVHGLSGQVVEVAETGGAAP